MDTFKGFYITTKNIDDIRLTISDIIDMNKLKPNSDKDNKALCKAYCEKTYRLLEECFVPDMWGVERAKKLLKRDKDSDNLSKLCSAKTIADGILFNISLNLKKVFPLKDLPSCRKLLDFSSDIAYACAKDLIKSKVIKVGMEVLLLKSKVDDAVTIEDVWHFYNEIVTELEREILEEGWALSPVEQSLFLKSKAERAYCYKAMIKTGFGITKELKDIMDELNVDMDIRQYESIESLHNSTNYMIVKQR
jgi:hypothetical protein